MKLGDCIVNYVYLDLQIKAKLLSFFDCIYKKTKCHSAGKWPVVCSFMFTYTGLIY